MSKRSRRLKRRRVCRRVACKKIREEVLGLQLTASVLRGQRDAIQARFYEYQDYSLVAIEEILKGRLVARVLDARHPLEPLMVSVQYRAPDLASSGNKVEAGRYAMDRLAEQSVYARVQSETVACDRALRFDGLEGYESQVLDQVLAALGQQLAHVMLKMLLKSSVELRRKIGGGRE